MNWG